MKFGDYRVEIVPDCEFRLDGGAMFGVVPRNLWSRTFPPDEQNRIRMNMNCVFIETGPEKILIETGIGDKWSEKHVAMYGIDRKRSLDESLQTIAGVNANEITIVINTHLHFDHAGGNTKHDQSGTPVASFPNARYFISRVEYEHAESPTDRDRASYLVENWRPLKDSGQVELKDADYEVAPGLSMETYGGHNRSMQWWRLDRGGASLVGVVACRPPRPPVALRCFMGYERSPAETMADEKKLLPQAAREGWACLFYHDPQQPL